MDVLKGEEDWRTNRVVLSTICSHLEVDDLLQTALVSRDWNDATKPALYRKAVVKVNRASPLVQELNWVSTGTDTQYETGIAQFNHFVEYVNSLKEYRFEGLELSWCPLMKNHTVWAKVAPPVKTLIVCKFHEEVCTTCDDSTGFLKSVLAVFGNVTCLTAGDHLPCSWQPLDFEDLYEKQEEEGLPDPEIKSFEKLESLVISAAFSNVDANFIASLIPQLKRIDVCSLSDEKKWLNFGDFIRQISSHHENLKTTMMETGIKCDIPIREFRRLRAWFGMCAAKKVKFWYSSPGGWADPCHTELDQSFFYFPSVELWIVLDLSKLPTSYLKPIVHTLLTDMAWPKVLSYRLSLERFAEWVSSQVVEDTAIWKRTFPSTGLTSLLVYSNLDLDQDQLMKVLPTASYLVISRAGQVIAEFFGTSQLLFGNTVEILNSSFITSGEHAENKHHLIHVPAFRHHVGIPDSWYPKDLNEKDKSRCVLVYFAIDTKLLDEVRKNLSRFIYPATKLKNTFQIFRSFEKDYEESEKTILNWTDPICLRLASGESVVEGSSYKVFRA